MNNLSAKSAHPNPVRRPVAATVVSIAQLVAVPVPQEPQSSHHLHHTSATRRDRSPDNVGKTSLGERGGLV
ncbi:MAG: hypothetical protein RID09_01365 [Coleofasciculus sp. G1-WW12-02]|uniref:hypothetical protein n=1 Tax=Coleofasciculus sp. G1-WW12-02 TaxID=3068483 RepID=UPI003303BF26